MGVGGGGGREGRGVGRWKGRTRREREVFQEVPKYVGTYYSGATTTHLEETNVIPDQQKGFLTAAISLTNSFYHNISLPLRVGGGKSPPALCSGV